MFSQRQNRNMVSAGFTTLALIYHQTVYNVRKTSRNPVAGLISIMAQSVLLVMVFLAMFYLIGIKTSPVRGDFLLFIMSGIFIFMTHVKAVAAVAGSHSVSSGLLKHEPLNAAVLISSAALAALYQQVLSCAVILTVYHLFFQQISFYYWQGAACMFILAWFLGCCIGLVFLGITPWAPKIAPFATMLYTRVNMFASGKMFLANSLPGFLMPWFEWNPLFHLIDQSRGFIFINYSPRVTDILYPVWFAIAALMLGLIINFTTRKFESVSWGAGN